MSRIIRLTVVAAGLLGAAACVINPPSSGTAASAPRAVISALPRSPGPSGSSVWVLSTVGLNVRSAPDPQAQVLTTVTQSARLDVSETQKAGSDTWLHVKTKGGQVEGWVLDRPDLVIHQAVSLHVESTSGYSILFPATWSPTSGNPAAFTSAPGDPLGSSMLIQTGDDPSKLLATPTSPGKEVRQESPIEVYGRTTFLTVYKLDGGGYEYDVKVQFPKTKVAYLFNFKQVHAGDADTSQFKQLLGSVVIPGEG